MDPFIKCCDFLIDIEGGDKLVNHASDPGGLTKFGISQRRFPLVKIADLSHADAVALYRRHYWDFVGCPSLPLPLAMMHFDCAVNQGEGIAPKLLQLSVGVVADGQLGSKTLAAANRGRVVDHVKEYAARRMHRYGTTKNWDVNGLGWSRRLMDCLTFCLEINR
jgi:lysozyme family protein